MSMSATAMQAAQQHVPITTASAYPSSASNSRQYLDQESSHDDAQLSNHNVYAISSQQSRDARRAQVSPTSSHRQYNIVNDPAAYHDGSATNLPIHSRSPQSPSSQQDGSPYVPPRTTSQHHSSAHTTPSRYTGQNADAADYSDPSRNRSRDDTVTSARSRKRGPHSPEGPQRAASTRERGHEQGLPTQTRSEATMATHPGMVRENSEVINRVIISDPTVDEERMRARIAEAQPMQPSAEAQRLGLTQETYAAEDIRGPQRRQDYSKSKRREIQFGDYILGQTLGEGEFGKVKLGWKKDGSSQVAIKLIRRESVASNPTRLPKIYREISILQQLQHPNIVQLHEKVETERHIGIILEYASGGELFDHILNQRYLKDPSARRLFAQLVSGVGYLHKMGIVHRDLKLENLLLDQNKNIIITDFGFANTFNPQDELSQETEYGLSNKEFVRKYKLDRVDAKGMRRGDLMQTSCGSPCYAAPELVVSDSLYTGRKVDVWSCGVILYAMLAGYLPFDDDPANPEGDNINLLYKYITSTPLTFPEYVTPHARDLLRRILVPNPRKRADLFEVARHSWLTEYHHVVAHITSSTTNIADIANSTVTGPDDETPSMPRSVSVRVPPSAQTQQNVQPQTTTQNAERAPTRHTLQAEYVAPTQHTERIAPGPVTQRPLEPQEVSATPMTSKPLPQEPVEQQRPVTATRQNQNLNAQAAPDRPVQNLPPTTSNVTTTVTTTTMPVATTQYTSRPATQGSLTPGNGPTRSDLRLPSRGSYGQPVAPSVATTTVQGKVTQPQKNGRAYNISGPQYQHDTQNSIGQPMADQTMGPPQPPQKTQHHRRTSTLSSLGEKLFGRSNSVVKKEQDENRQKAGKKYPPTAMKNPYPAEEPQPRMSTDSKRSFNFLRKKESQEVETNDEKSPGRRSSLLQSMSFKNIMSGKKNDTDSQRTFTPDQSLQGRPNTVGSNYPNGSDGQQERRNQNFSRPVNPQVYGHRTQQSTGDVYGSTGVYQNDVQGFEQEQDDNQGQLAQHQDSVPNQSRPSMSQARNTLTKPRRFNDAYDQDHHRAGGNGAVKRVQDFFRRRGRARADSGYR